MIRFINEKRKCGCTVEGFGEYATFWYDYEIKCGQCGLWTAQYGDVSIESDHDPEEHYWICPKCIAENELDEGK